MTELPAPGLIWEDTVDDWSWRVVLAHRHPVVSGTYGPSTDYSAVESYIVIERTRRQAALGEDIWEQQQALPDVVLQELLRSQQPRPVDEQVKELLAGGESLA